MAKSPLIAELERFGYALIWFLLCSSSMALVQVRNDKIYAKTYRAESNPGHLSLSPQRTVYDVVFEAIPNFSYIPFFEPDIALHSFIVFSIIAAVYRWALAILISRTRRFFWLLGTGYLMRAICLFGTILPPSNPECIPLNRSLLECFLTLPSLLFGQVHTCTDKIFSGHTLVATLLLLFWKTEQITLRKSFAMSTWRAYPFIHVLYIVSSSVTGRNHYLVDVAVSVLLTTLLYYSYVWLLALARMYEPTAYFVESERLTPSDRLLWLARWMEGDDIVHRKIAPFEQC